LNEVNEHEAEDSPAPDKAGEALCVLQGDRRTEPEVCGLPVGREPKEVLPDARLSTLPADTPVPDREAVRDGEVTESKGDETMAKLNLDTFNEILFSAFKEQSPQNMLELLSVEIQSAYAMKIDQMEKVIADLNNGRPYHQNLQLVNNIDSNLDSLAEKVDKIYEEHPELRKEEEDDDRD
jgi:hypothetical protein